MSNTSQLLESRARQTSQPEWTDESVNRFWDHFAQREDTSQKYFSRMWATQLTKLLRDTGKLKGKLLDYGCGPGYLLEELIKEPIECYGADPSPLSVEQSQARLKNHPNWHGCLKVNGTPTDYEDCTFDVITCIETVEHLTNGILTETMAEIHRLLKPGGIVLLTTPYNEDLEANMHYCPFCDSEFHRMQHIQTWQLEDIATLLRDHGMEASFCHSMRLASYGHEPTAATLTQHFPRGLLHFTKFHLLKFMDRISPKPFPHGRITQSYDLRSTTGRNLIAIGTRQ